MFLKRDNDDKKSNSINNKRIVDWFPDADTWRFSPDVSGGDRPT